MMNEKREKGSIMQVSIPCKGNNGLKNVDVSSILRVQHLQRLATWASREAQIAPLAAFLGERLAAKSEASGIPLDQSIFLCEKCETILHPGMNCTIRIEKSRQSKKSPIAFQNNVIYYCDFCSHRNEKWGTRKGHVKGLLAAGRGHSSKQDSSCSTNEIKEPSVRGQLSEEAEPSSSSTKNGLVGRATISGSVENPPVTPLTSRSNKKKRMKSGSAVSGTGRSSIVAAPEKGTTDSRKRRRKGCTSLKEIVERNQSENISALSNFAIPFQI